MTRTLMLCAFVALVRSIPAFAGDLVSTDWLFTFETRSLGPIETVMHVARVEGGYEARTRGVNPIAIDLVAGEGGEFSGPLVSGKPGPKATLKLEGDRIEGSVDSGLLRGSFRAVPWSGKLPLRDYQALLSSLDHVVKRQIYKPAELDTQGWKTFRAEAEELAAKAKDDFDFLTGIRKAWKNDPFSHFQMQRSAVPVEAMIASFDAMRTGRDSARLAFDGDVAILTVDTMMGQDTIEQIDAAYATIATRGAKALVIDLRQNDGGAFAVRPLVQHVIGEPLDAGVFLSNRWWTSKSAFPSAAEIGKVEPWSGWSIIDFWRDAQANGLLRIRFEPQAPRFDGKVFVLTSKATSSAAEFATDALRASGRARIVGETTAGHMLSGSYFDVADGFIVFLPVADYVSRRIGRIDGFGVAPDVAVPADDALARALALARE